ncbi:MAG: DUF177 domain-containing protein [Firmicutes bacterium]|nr:DUF177 domain-containing protein [Bacillota bacterium]
MKIDVEALRSAGGKAITYAFTLHGANLEMDSEDVQFLEPVQVQLKAMYGEGKVKVQGSLRTRLILTCGRCLKSFSYHYSQEFEDEIQVTEETAINSVELIRDIFMTTLPLKPLCDAACRGLCPTCGADLNQTQCGCPADNLDPRLLVLKKLLD